MYQESEKFGCDKNLICVEPKNYPDSTCHGDSKFH